MLEKLKEIIGGQFDVTEGIEESTRLKEDLGADSLDLFEFVMALEEEFNVEIPTEELTDIQTVKDIMVYLKNKGVEE